IAYQKPVQDGRAKACKPFLDACAGRHAVLKALDIAGDVTHHDGGEERLLPRKPGIDGRLSSAGQLGDFVDAGAGKPALQKHAAGRIEDAGVDLAGEVARRPPGASGGALLQTGARWELCHHILATASMGATATAAAGSPPP